MHIRHATVSSLVQSNSGTFFPPRQLIAKGRDNHSALRGSFSTSAAAVYNLALHKPLASARQKASSAGLRMGVLDSVPLVLANGNTPQAPPSAPLLCLFFSAQWCPDCVRFLPSLVEAYKGFDASKIDIVFVSSDRTQALQQRYMKEAHHPDWPAVTFEGEYRADLKRRYGACAGSEMSTLGISPAERTGGVPTMVVLRAADGVLLTTDGVRDIGQAGAGAVGLWEAVANAAAAAK